MDERSYDRKPYVPQEKLIRDDIPQLIRMNDGPTSFILDRDYRKAEPEELRGLLHAKLFEEIREYLGSGDKKELADILEVIYTLALLDNVKPDELNALRIAKLNDRGGFWDRYVMLLKGTDDEKRAAVGLRPVLENG